MLDFDNTLTIVRLCVNANRADLIENALFDRQTVSDVRALIESEAATAAALSAADERSAHGGSLWGGPPTAKQRDQLAAVVERRLRAMYPATGKSSA